MSYAFVVFYFIFHCVCELVICVYCAGECSIRIDNFAEWQDFFGFCLRSRCEVTIGCIYCPMTFKLIGSPLLQATIPERSWKDSMNIVNTLNRFGKAVRSKSRQSYSLAQESTLTRFSWLGYPNGISIVEQLNGIFTYIRKGYLIGGRVLLHITPWTLSTTSSALFKSLMSGITISLHERSLSFDDLRMFWCVKDVEPQS